jgi:hypothetical protein
VHVTLQVLQRAATVIATHKVQVESTASTSAVVDDLLRMQKEVDSITERCVAHEIDKSTLVSALSTAVAAAQEDDTSRSIEALKKIETELRDIAGGKRGGASWHEGVPSDSDDYAKLFSHYEENFMDFEDCTRLVELITKFKKTAKATKNVYGKYGLVFPAEDSDKLLSKAKVTFFEGKIMAALNDPENVQDERLMANVTDSLQKESVEAKVKDSLFFAPLRKQFKMKIDELQ